MTDLDTASPRRSVVVTGGSQGVGAAIGALLADDAHVIVLDVASTLSWEHPSVSLVSGDARDPAVARRAAEAAEAVAPLSGWVNNAAIFQDAAVMTATAPEILEMITANLGLALTGSHTAVAHFVRHGRGGAIVNVSSHQAQRPVRGALPYATSKAAIEGLTKALAVDHGPAGIRTNAVALGSIATERYAQYRREHPGVDEEMAALHPLGRVGLGSEVAETVAFLLSDRASFLNGVILPVDGGRAVQGADPEAR